MTEKEKRSLVLKIAESYIGVKESPPNSNNVIFNTRFYGHPVQDGIALNGKPDKNAFYPWCATSMSEIFQEAKLALGKIGWTRGFAGCPYALLHLKEWGVEVSFEEAKPADLVFYDFDINGKFDHVGLLKSKDLIGKLFRALEGNTSATGSQSNGGEFMDKQRKYFGGVKFVRPNVYNL